MVTSPDALTLLAYMSKQTKADRKTLMALGQKWAPLLIPRSESVFKKMRAYLLQRPRKTSYSFTSVSSCAFISQVKFTYQGLKRMQIEVVRPLTWLANDFNDHGDTWVFEYADNLDPRTRALWRSKSVQEFKKQFHEELNGEKSMQVK